MISRSLGKKAVSYMFDSSDAEGEEEDLGGSDTSEGSTKPSKKKQKVKTPVIPSDDGKNSDY